MFLLIACTATPSGDSSTSIDSDPLVDEVPLDWGVVSDCDSSQEGGFDAFYAEARNATLVVADEDLGPMVHGWYSRYFNDLELVHPDAVTDEQLEGNLFIVGSVADNSVLADLADALPANFEAERFTFGGYRYANPGDGIAFIHPSPHAEGKMLLLHVGNSFHGAYATFTVPTGQKNYQTVHGRGVAWQKGNFCVDAGPWTVDSGRDKDSRAD
ncbi:MAG: hypothetical protein GY913_15620 [Proteobacteria bacterium]|nr:hypothetical protein [Pseudomonadota bacterium]MCP4918338.1 hypothetical protein [Pseudomonadota bacterium]